MLAGAAKLYHAAHTRRVPRRVCTASGKVATEFQSDSSRTDSPVRILHAQPRSPLSVAHIRHLKKFTTFYTVSATKARAAASRGVALARTISSVPRLALQRHLALNWVVHHDQRPGMRELRARVRAACWVDQRPAASRSASQHGSRVDGC